MNRPRYSAQAQQDMRKLLAQISQDRPEAAKGLLNRIRKTCRLLAKAPAIGSSREEIAPGLRCFSVGNYVIYFQPAHDGIHVLRVVHGAQDEGTLFE